MALFNWMCSSEAACFGQLLQSFSWTFLAISVWYHLMWWRKEFPNKSGAAVAEVEAYLQASQKLREERNNWMREIVK